MRAVEVAAIVGSGLATGLGGLALLVVRRPGERTLDTMLGFTAGVMVAASAFSLLVPALDRGSLAEVLGGFALGVAAISALDLTLPHVHLRFAERGARDEPATSGGRRAGLLLGALTIHNVPEGMAVGVAFAAGGTDLGVPIALAIGIQNVPEGFAAAAPLLARGVSNRRAALVALATGIVEPPTALAAMAAFELASGMLPVALAFAAGAMLYVVVDELIPESHARGHERLATFGFSVGFVLMVGLDNAFR